MIRLAIAALLLLVAAQEHVQNDYPWVDAYDLTNSVEQRFATPQGFRRDPFPAGSFGEWLRKLPLKSGCPPVLLYNGQPKSNQSVHVAVIDIDVGIRDLQQCADAVMRLRGEYLFAKHFVDSIGFHFTNGFLCDYRHWLQGYRPRVSGDQTVTWDKTEGADVSYAVFRKYIETVFVYAGSWSLEHEAHAQDLDSMVPGNFFIQGGFPGHAVIVMDVCHNPQTGEKMFMLAQSYMPAQDMHILKNPENGSAWYRVPDERLITPEWVFGHDDLRRF